jgi:hypothetical protein
MQVKMEECDERSRQGSSVTEVAQHVATIRSIIFIIGFLAIAVTGELLESRTTLQRCAALFGIVLLSAVAVILTTPPMPTMTAAESTRSVGA